MAEPNVSIDPICGRPVVEDGASSFEYKRRTYFFCSPGCRGRFERRAERIRVAELARLGALFARPRRAHWGLA
jgi:YHS domain-containing protein